MKKGTNVILWAGIVLMSCVCCVGYFSLIRPGIGTRWVQEPAPPAPITHFELGEAGEVLGFTSDGTIYEFDYGIYGNTSSWKEVTQPSGIPAIGGGCHLEGSDRLVLPPPGKVISRIREDCVYIESGYHLEVVLLENGEIWSWEHETYAYAVLFIMVCLLAGLVIGGLLLLTGSGIWIIQKLKDKNKSPDTQAA